MRLHQLIPLAFAMLIRAVCPAASQAQTAHPHTAAAAPAPKSKAAPKLSDQQLEARIREKFAKSKSASTFKVHVQGGVATIEGKTEVLQHKGAATRMAKVAGAVMVNNKVDVSEAAKEKAAGNLEEGRRRVQVKRGDTRSERK